jgi:hypothetical protein
VEILAGTNQLRGTGDAEAYLVTVCEQLERLGHEVLVFCAEPGEAPGLRVVSVERRLPLAPDVIYAQDAYAALLLADIYPLTPQVFALHDDRDELWLPPQLPAVIARVVVFDERGGERARAASLVHEIVRLRRPVDIDRFSPLGPLRDRPRAAVLHLEHLSDYRRGVVERACADAGIEAGPDADLVVGRGLQILEAMASGRAAYVYGEEGGDGWVTAEHYELLEADGFSGRAEASATDFERLRGDLDAYDPAMGPSNRELALAHSARDHAQELLEIFGSLAPRRDPVDAPLRELARLVRVEAATAGRADAATDEAYEAKARARELERELAEAHERSDRLTDRVAGLEQALREAQEREEAATAAAAQKQGGVRGLLGREGKVPSTEG